MFRYLLRRLLLSIPTLLVISWVIFGLNKCAPGDPVTTIYGEDLTSGFDLKQQSASYRLKAARLGLDRPDFYFSLTTTAYPDTLYRIFPPERRLRLTRLAGQVHNWPLVSRYEQSLMSTLLLVDQTPDSLPQKTQLRRAMSDLLSIQQVEFLDTARQFMRRAATGLPGNPAFSTTLDSLDNAVSELQSASQKRYFPQPAFYWYGLDNQYYNWISGFFFRPFRHFPDFQKSRVGRVAGKSDADACLERTGYPASLPYCRSTRCADGPLQKRKI